MLYGLRALLSQSFGLPAPPLTEKNLPDQTGKVYIITGANTGVGYQVASILYSRNAKVYVAARSEDKAKSAIEAITALYPKSTGSLHYLHLDLSDLSTIKQSVQDFLSREDKLHWIDNNAGVMVPPRGSKGAQGLDLTYQTNILGPFLFTKLLLPILKKTADAEPDKGSVRVSWAGSLAVVVQSPRGGNAWRKDDDGQDTLDDTKPDPVIYGVSKAANFYFGAEFARRHGSDGVLHNSYNPGNLRSDLQRHLPRIALWILSFMLYPPIFGAYTELYSGLSRVITLEKDQGGYVIPWGRKSTVRPDLIAEVQKGPDGQAAKLYDWCDRVTKEYQ